MRLSFVIPAYNEEAYLGDCIRSILVERCASYAEIARERWYMGARRMGRARTYFVPGCLLEQQTLTELGSRTS